MTRECVLKICEEVLRSSLEPILQMIAEDWDELVRSEIEDRSGFLTSAYTLKRTPRVTGDPPGEDPPKGET